MRQYKDDKFADILGDKLRSLREEPPADMFDRIEQTLMTMGIATEESATPAPQPTNTKAEPKVVPLWSRPFVRAVAAAMVAAMVALAVVVTLRDNTPTDMEFVAEQLEQTPSQVQSVETEVEITEPEKIELVAMNIAEPVATSEIVNLRVDRDVLKESTNEEQMVSSEQNDNTVQQKKRTSVRERKKRDNTSSSRHNQQELEEYWRAALGGEPRERGSEHPIEVGLYAANIGFNRGHTERNDMTNSPIMVVEQSEVTSGSSYFSPLLVKQDNRSNLEHFMPITMGVTLSYSISDWLSVDSGLLYTKVYSKGDTNGMLSHYSRSRTLNYVGVPLALSVYFANFDHFWFYGRLGGTAELCVGAYDKTLMDGEFVDRVALDVPTTTFSLDAAVGATYSLWGGIGLFGEVGGSYWFAPQGYAENYRTVNPFSLSTRFGLRFTFN